MLSYSLAQGENQKQAAGHEVNQLHEMPFRDAGSRKYLIRLALAFLDLSLGDFEPLVVTPDVAGFRYFARNLLLH